MEHNFIIVTQASRYPQMGPLYLSSALKRVGITTHIVSSDISNEELDTLINEIDPIALGCSVMTAPEILDFVRISQHVQEMYNRARKTIPVIWGGMHPTIVPYQTTDEWYIDLVVSGEAEVTLPRVLLGLTHGEWPTQPLVYVETPPILDAYTPDWDAIDVTQYVFTEKHSVHVDVETHHSSVFYYLLSSRGCTYKCTFCWETQRTSALKEEMRQGESSLDLTWRAHSIEWVRRQIAYLRERTAIDGIGFWDDMPFGRGHRDWPRAKMIFELMREYEFGYLLEARANQLAKPELFWGGSTHDREADLYRFLQDTGCMQVFVGAESADQTTLNDIVKKGTRVADYRRLVELSRNIELPIRFSLIVGFPGETEDSVNRTLDWAEELEDEPMISVSGPKLFTPYPGTTLFSTAVGHGFVVPRTTIEWASINRYSEYEERFPWVRAYSHGTQDRVRNAFLEVDAEKRKQPKDVLERSMREAIQKH